jgi:hypothetical protein
VTATIPIHDSGNDSPTAVPVRKKKKCKKRKPLIHPVTQQMAEVPRTSPKFRRMAMMFLLP